MLCLHWNLGIINPGFQNHSNWIRGVERRRRETERLLLKWPTPFCHQCFQTNWAPVASQDDARETKDASDKASKTLLNSQSAFQWLWWEKHLKQAKCKTMGNMENWSQKGFKLCPPQQDILSNTSQLLGGWQTADGAGAQHQVSRKTGCGLRNTKKTFFSSRKQCLLVLNRLAENETVSRERFLKRGSGTWHLLLPNCWDASFLI